MAAFMHSQIKRRCPSIVMVDTDKAKIFTTINSIRESALKPKSPLRALAYNFVDLDNRDRTLFVDMELLEDYMESEMINPMERCAMRNQIIHGLEASRIRPTLARELDEIVDRLVATRAQQERPSVIVGQVYLYTPILPEKKCMYQIEWGLVRGP
jgi:hypothetical protein